MAKGAAKTKKQAKTSVLVGGELESLFTLLRSAILVVTVKGMEPTITMIRKSSYWGLGAA